MFVAPPGADTPKYKTCAGQTCLFPQGQGSPAAAAPAAPAATRCCAFLTHTLREVQFSLSCYHRLPRQGCYLKPAGDFGFPFSLSAMTPLYFSAISSSEHEPPRKHLSGPAML